MRWSFTVARVGETEVRIHVTLLVLVAWYAWGGWRLAGVQGALDQSLLMALLFASVLLHEFGHILAARRYGIPTPDVLLTPIGGVARIGRLPDRPLHEFVIAVAGPLVTLALVILLGAAVFLAEGREHLLPARAGDLSLLAAICWVNVILLAFNLLPAFPMDGGRMLRAGLSRWLGSLRGTRIAARIGQALAIGFAIVGLQYNPFLMLIAVFVFLGAEAELEHVQTRALAGDLTAGRLTVTDLRIFPPTLRIDEAIGILTRSDQRAFPVLDDGGHLLGIVTRDDLLRGVGSAGLDGPVTAAMSTPAETGTIRVGSPFDEAVGRLYEGKRDALPVVDEADRFVGLLTRDNVTDILLVRQLRERAAG